MPWPYHFVDLTSEEKHLRRELIDRYGVYAQLSALIPILVFQLYRLGVWVYHERRRPDAAYSAVPTSPGLKSHRKSKAGALIREWRALLWWLEGDVAEGWGERGHWIAGGCWTLWLLFLSVHRTGDDYLHITKRFGEIAVSQFPLHYALCMKSPYTSPLALAFRSSHEQLNPWHRMLGRIIYGLLILHAAWYLNFFVQSGILSTRLKAPVVIIGILAFSMLTIVASSSMEYVRRWSYRVFFVLHLAIGVTIIPLLWFHASHLRYYIVEALMLFILDIVARKLDTFTEFAQIIEIPHTKLLQLKIRVPASKIQRFKTTPAQHVYLSIPPESTPANKSTPSIHDLLYNPFTVADVSENDITLVLRSQNGPTTTALQHLATLSKARPPIKIEGPYGCSKGFPNLAKDFDRILLVAGGVGATFALPIYRHLREQFEDRGRSPELVTFIWSMTASSEATWALNTETNEDIKEGGNVKIFYTKNISAAQQYHEETLPLDGSVEMQDLQGTKLEEPFTASGRQRPDLKKLVDETFAHGNEERVAILVCGPVGMARELREHVGDWVEKGRYVWFHNEGFGW